MPAPCRSYRAGGGTVHARRSLVAVLAGIALFAGAGENEAAASPIGPAVAQPPQELATLLRSQMARSAPAVGSAPLRRIQARRPLTGVRTVLPVVEHRNRGGVRWLRVQLPGRPNGRTGWIRRQGTVTSRTRWHIVVDTSSRHVIVYQQGRRARVFRAVVGKPSTPTPAGRFFVEETIRLPAGAVGAPFALALSARSTVLQKFAGGPGQIGVHGRWNVGGTLGTAVSHGCVRLDTVAMRWLVMRIAPGTPVTIRR